jgi:hypothetical protein
MAMPNNLRVVLVSSGGLPGETTRATGEGGHEWLRAPEMARNDFVAYVVREAKRLKLKWVTIGGLPPRGT